MVKTLLKQLDFNNIIIGLLFLYIGVVYFSIAAANIVLGVTLFVFVLGIAIQKIQLNFNKQNWVLYVFIIVPFLLTIVSVLYSDNAIRGLKYLWLRLPILVTPFILLFINISNKNIKTGLKVFAFLTVLASIITLYNAIRYINEDILFITDFTFFITAIQHPYFGIFVLITLISIIEFKLIKNKALKGSVYVLLVLAIALSTSRLVYLLFFLIMNFYFFKFFSKKKALFLGVLWSIFMLTFVLLNKGITSKFITSIQYENSPRLKLWNNAYKVITSSENRLFGIGIGDYYHNKKDPYFFKESSEGSFGYNPHSQIIEFFVTNGFLGFLIITTLIILGIKNIKKQNRFAIIVFGIIMFFSLTESVLSRQYGVQLYSLFIPLIFKKNFKR